jgi:hypothetical protein
MIGRSHNNDGVLALAGFEIFGELRPGHFWEIDRFPAINTVYKSKEPVRGLLSELTKRAGGCLHRLNTVIVTASSVASAGSGDGRNFEAVNAAAVGDSSSFQSGAEEGAWLCYDFYDKAVRLTAYTLMSHSGRDGGKGRCNLKSWRVEGSTDGVPWFTLDEQTGYDGLDDQAASQGFPLSTEGNTLGEFRFVRLVLTGPSSSNQNVIWIRAFELFGQIRCL